MPSASAVKALQQEAERARLVVVGSRGLGGFHNLLLGSVSLQLAGHAACPVVVARDGPNADHHEIVVGVDGSEYSTAAPAAVAVFTVWPWARSVTPCCTTLCARWRSRVHAPD